MGMKFFTFLLSGVGVGRGSATRFLFCLLVGRDCVCVYARVIRGIIDVTSCGERMTKVQFFWSHVSSSLDFSFISQSTFRKTGKEKSVAM